MAGMVGNKTSLMSYLPSHTLVLLASLDGDGSRGYVSRLIL